jgi:hypothetical protein
MRDLLLPGNCFCAAKAGKKRAEQSWPSGNCDLVYFIDAYLSLFKGVAQQGQNGFKMLA